MGMPQLASIILAAGQGTRMKSKLPKVIHPLLGKPVLRYVADSAERCGADPILIVIGFQGEKVMEAMGSGYQYIWQREQRGTGHALLVAEEALRGLDGDLLVLYGDTPLLKPETITELVRTKHQQGAVASILTTEMEDPTGYGRIIRGAEGLITAIVEQKDATQAQREIREVNTGVYCFSIPELLDALKKLSPKNAQGEYYLTDVFKILVDRGLTIAGLKTGDAEEVMGPNDRAQLARTENYLKRNINEEWMRQGVTIADPAFTYIGPEVEIGKDTAILPGTFLMGRTKIGEDCIIGPHTKISDSEIGAGTTVQFSQVIEARIGPENTIGPFAFIRPGTDTASQVKVGDFVELKNSVIGPGSKVPHLSYLGDTEVGAGVNIGAGTITCNYDGVHKHRTVIGDDAFIGSNANLVAPVRIGNGATVAAGSTITKEVPEKTLGVARAKQENKPEWRSPRQRHPKE